MSVGPGRVASDLTPVCGLMSAARRSSTKNAWPPFDGSGWRAFNKRGPVRATRTCRLAAHDLAAELPDN